MKLRGIAGRYIADRDSVAGVGVFPVQTGNAIRVGACPVIF